MAHPYEYDMSVKYLTPFRTTEMPDLLSEHWQGQLANSLTGCITEFSDHIDEITGYGWEVVSHDVELSGKVAILSLLLRRQKQSPA